MRGVGVNQSVQGTTWYRGFYRVASWFHRVNFTRSVSIPGKVCFWVPVYEVYREAQRELCAFLLG